MMKKNKLILFLLMFILGLLILFLPYINNYFYDINVKKLESNYKEKVGIQRDFDLLNTILIKENTKLFDNKQEDFLSHKISYDDNLIDLSNYGLVDNIIGFIIIPSIDVNLPIYLGASIKNMNYGAVHLTGTSYPIGGINTNSVIAAHRAYYKAKMFKDIDKINIGDYLYIENFNEVLKYKAVKKDIIDPTDFNKLTIVEGKDLITIISCHAYRERKKRIVVYFERII